MEPSRRIHQSSRIDGVSLSSNFIVKKTGNVFVERPEVLDDLINESSNNSVSSRSTRNSNSSHTLVSETSLQIQQKLARELLTMQTQQLELETKQNVAKLIKLKETQKDALYSRLNNHISQAKTLLDSVDKNLELTSEAERNKVRRQFHDWNTTVHGAIQTNIAKQLNSISSKELNRKKNEDYSKFLEITNRKPAIFRDIIIESEYDPLEPNRRAIKAKTKKLKDPTLIDQQKAESESNMLGGPIKKHVWGKDTLNVELWAAGKIEATPYGAFSKMMKEKSTDNEPEIKSVNETMKSKVVFDHFVYPRGKAALDPEMPKGKRVFPTAVYSNPRKVFDSIDDATRKELAAIHPPII